MLLAVQRERKELDYIYKIKKEMKKNNLLIYTVYKNDTLCFDMILINEKNTISE